MKAKPMFLFAIFWSSTVSIAQSDSGPSQQELVRRFMEAPDIVRSIFEAPPGELPEDYLESEGAVFCYNPLYPSASAFGEDESVAYERAARRVYREVILNNSNLLRGKISSPTLPPALDEQAARDSVDELGRNRDDEFKQFSYDDVIGNDLAFTMAIHTVARIGIATVKCEEQGELLW